MPMPQIWLAYSNNAPDVFLWKRFDVSHAVICPKGGFSTIPHNEVRDLTTKLLTEVYHHVEIEPKLQQLTGEHLFNSTANTDDGACLDVKARGFWDNMQYAFFDIRVFYPNAWSNQSSSLSTVYKKHEAGKKWTYA